MLLDYWRALLWNWLNNEVMIRLVLTATECMDALCLEPVPDHGPQLEVSGGLLPLPLFLPYWTSFTFGMASSSLATRLSWRSKELGKLQYKKKRKSSDNVTRGPPLPPSASASDSLGVRSWPTPSSDSLGVLSWPPIVSVIHHCFSYEGH